MTAELRTFRLINPSDPYTFKARSIEIAAAAVLQLSSGFGAECLSTGESTPVLFGWEPWLKDRGIDSEWVGSHLAEIGDCLSSFLIGDEKYRADVESMIARLPESEREGFILERQDRHRTSLNQIGESAYLLAKRIREKIGK